MFVLTLIAIFVLVFLVAMVVQEQRYSKPSVGFALIVALCITIIWGYYL